MENGEVINFINDIPNCENDPSCAPKNPQPRDPECACDSTSTNRKQNLTELSIIFAGIALALKRRKIRNTVNEK